MHIVNLALAHVRILIGGGLAIHSRVGMVVVRRMDILITGKVVRRGVEKT